MGEISFRLSVPSILLSLALCMKAAEVASPEPALAARVSGAFNFGAVEGFLQTPAGGQPGSSSHRRPTLDELGIDDATFYDVLASVQWRHLDFYVGYQSIGLDGNATLSENLVSRGVTFAAGTRVRSEADLNWVRTGVGWKFDLLQRRLELVPKAELALLDFSYDLSGGAQAVDRSYAKGCFRLGLETRYRFNRVLSVSLAAAGSMPISNTPQIATITSGIQFDLWPGNRRPHPWLFIGGGAQRIEYEDNQELPNHFRVGVRPFIAGGLGISF